MKQRTTDTRRDLNQSPGSYLNTIKEAHKPLNTTLRIHNKFGYIPDIKKVKHKQGRSFERGKRHSKSIESKYRSSIPNLK